MRWQPGTSVDHDDIQDPGARPEPDGQVGQGRVQRVAKPTPTKHIANLARHDRNQLPQRTDSDIETLCTLKLCQPTSESHVLLDRLGFRTGRKGIRVWSRRDGRLRRRNRGRRGVWVRD